MRNPNQQFKQFLQSGLFILCLAFYGVSQAQAKDRIIIDPGKDRVNSSKELQVSPDFMFTDFRSYNLTISVTDDLVKPLEGAIVKVFHYDPFYLPEPQLLFVARSDEAGWVERQLEVSNQVKKILIVTNVVGRENEQLVTLSEKEDLFIKF